MGQKQDNLVDLYTWKVKPHGVYGSGFGPTLMGSVGTICSTASSSSRSVRAVLLKPNSSDAAPR